jgi:hypothetical protein
MRAAKDFCHGHDTSFAAVVLACWSRLKAVSAMA